MAEQIIHKHKTNNKFEKRRNIKAIWRVDCDTLEKLEKYESTTEAAKWIRDNNLTRSKKLLALGQKLINVSNGKTKSAYGYKWLYEETETDYFEDEIWKEIESEMICVNNYFVSNYGRIKNNKGEICKLKPNPHGYIKISINKKSYSVHRLVALTFIPNAENKEFVNHIDGNKTNNNLKNLEWATCGENNIHKINSGLSNVTKKVIQYDINMNKLNEFISIIDASKKLNLLTSTITNSCNNKIKCTRRDQFIFRFG